MSERRDPAPTAFDVDAALRRYHEKTVADGALRDEPQAHEATVRRIMQAIAEQMVVERGDNG